MSGQHAKRPLGLCWQKHRRFRRRISPAISRKNCTSTIQSASVCRTGQSRQSYLSALVLRACRNRLNGILSTPPGQPPQPLQLFRHWSGRKPQIGQIARLSQVIGKKRCAINSTDRKVGANNPSVISFSRLTTPNKESRYHGRRRSDPVEECYTAFY